MSDELPPLHDLPPGVKADNNALFVHHMVRGGIVPSADAAVRIAELLCAIHEGTEEAERQKPFTAEDKGSYWRVEGSFNRDGAVEGSGPWYLSIEKHNGRVTDIGTLFQMKLTPEALEILRRGGGNEKQKK